MTTDDSHLPHDDADPRPTAGDGSATTDLDRLCGDLADGLYRLAIEAGQLEQLVLEAGGPERLEGDTRLRLDQAQSNATAIAATLDRIGFG